MIRAEKVTVRFGKLVALERVSLDVEPGQILGLIGANGAGKTTLIRVLAGVLQPAEGRAVISGFDAIREGPAAHRQVGFMPDFIGIHEHLTAREYLELFGEMYGLSGASLAGSIESSLATVRLQEKADDFVDDLSRGMAQRLSLARAILHDPAAYLLDEPASGLDPASRVELWSVLRGLAARDKAVLISSHILSELDDLITHAAVIEHGKVLFSGPRSELLRHAPRRRVRFKILTAPLAGQARELLLSGGANLLPERQDGFWDVEVPDDDRLVGTLLRALVERGIDLTLPAAADDTLERAYLGLTAKEPS